MVKRKSPIRHSVGSHIRNGKQIDSYERGTGQKSQRSKPRVVVGQTSDTWYYEQYMKIDSDWKEPKQLKDVPEEVWRYAYLNEKSTPELNPLRYIDISIVDTPTLDNMRESREYFEKNKGVVYEIKLMSPDEYFREAARCRESRRQVSSEHRRSLMVDRERLMVNDELARKFADLMKSGDKFALPYVDYDYGNQEGRHRARALEMLGVRLFPVLVVRSVD